MEAVEDFLKENTNFVSDRSREKFMFTFLPQGFLKRIR
jgi:cephalosporin hydroxylase